MTETINRITAAAAQGLTRAETIATVLGGRSFTAAEQTAFDKARGIWKLREAKRKAERKPAAAMESERVDAYRKRKYELAPKVAAELPKVDEKRKRRALRSLYDFLKTYGPGALCTYAPPKEMRRIVDEMERLTQGVGRYQIMMSRGLGKTTITSALAVYRLVKGLSRFVEIIAATDGKSTDIFDAMTSVFESEPFATDFPQLAVPIRESQHNSIRMMRLTYEGRKVGMEWRAGRMILPDIPDSPCPAAKIVVKGFTAKDLRGLNIHHERPDFIILDDIQDDKMAMNPRQTLAAYKKINGTIRGQFAHHRVGAMVMTATPIAPGDLTDLIENDAAWVTVKYPLMLSMPTNAKLCDEYGEIVRAEIAAKKINQPPEVSSNAWYKKHRREIEAGAKAVSPHVHNAEELTAVQHALNILYTAGEDVFETEYQMKPTRATSVYNLTDRDILANTNGVRQFCVPKVCADCVVATIDVMSIAGLRWCVTAFGPDRAAAVVTYGRWPEVGRLYKENAAAETADQAIAAAVRSLIRSLRDDIHLFIDGTRDEIPIYAVGIDAGWKTRVVTPVAESLNGYFRGGVATMKGVSWEKFAPRTAGGTLRKGIDADDEWAMRLHSKYGVVHIGFHADYWREVTQRAWFKEPLTSGSLSLFGDRPDPHLVFAQECCANQIVSKDKTKAGVEMWKWQKQHPDDHMGDCVSMGFVLAYWKKFYKPYLPGEAAKPQIRRVEPVADPSGEAPRTVAESPSPQPRQTRRMSRFAPLVIR